jgi:hypothetical protein
MVLLEATYCEHVVQVKVLFTLVKKGKRVVIWGIERKAFMRSEALEAASDSSTQQTKFYQNSTLTKLFHSQGLEQLNEIKNTIQKLNSCNSGHRFHEPSQNSWFEGRIWGIGPKEAEALSSHHIWIIIPLVRQHRGGELYTEGCRYGQNEHPYAMHIHA